MSTQQFDAIIIGSGQAGTPLVFKMAAQGKMVAFIEKEHFGGRFFFDDSMKVGNVFNY